jgi:hypothetical protein
MKMMDEVAEVLFTSQQADCEEKSMFLLLVLTHRDTPHPRIIIHTEGEDAVRDDDGVIVTSFSHSPKTKEREREYRVYLSFGKRIRRQ